MTLDSSPGLRPPSPVPTGEGHARAADLDLPARMETACTVCGRKHATQARHWERRAFPCGGTFIVLQPKRGGPFVLRQFTAAGR